MKREAEGRGGSLSLTEQVTVGDTILAAFPSNMFQLVRKVKKLQPCGWWDQHYANDCHYA